MRTIKLTIEYDGTRYVGWQRQLNGQSIQGEIESALLNILQQQVNVIGAGRTDAGVHARGQVAHFQAETGLTLYQIASALNSALPEDIVIHHAEEVSPDFHARYSAKERIYSYYITRQETALDRLFRWHLRYTLDLEAMKRASACLPGEHDFEAFSKVGSDVKHYGCNVNYSIWEERDSLLMYTVSANRFLRGMVRALVGSMVDVGRGLLTPEEFKEHLDTKKKYEPRTAAPAQGLILEKVLY